MKKVLVTYASLSGSTVAVAQAIGEEVAAQGMQVDVLPLSAVKRLEDYDGVVVGGPMLLGWHRGALGFLKRHQAALRRVPLAVFAMAMSLTDTREASVAGVPIYVDEKLPRPPANPAQLNFRERYATVTRYVRPMVAATRTCKPVSIGLFGGRLEYGRLPWWGVLFAMFVIQAPAADRRNWTAIRSWAASLPAAFGLAAAKAPPGDLHPLAARQRLSVEV
jgi:menaquinone-dependent protoporphyrinogen IX oxidase